MKTIKTAGVVLIGMILGWVLKNPVITSALSPYFNLTATILKQPPGSTLVNFVAIGIIYVIVAVILAIVIDKIHDEI
jgi:phosphotransferase system  glucose/maltose/N-acetylglucosamine-specific IIC component